MSTDEFADIAASRKKALDSKAWQGKLMTPFTWLLRGVFGLSRLLGCEAWLFRHFVKPFAGMFSTAIGKAFVDYTPTEHDVFVCSYYKSGTNWLMYAAYQVAEKGTGEFNDILDVAPWPDCPAQETTIALRDQRPIKRSITGQRVIKTHARAEFVPYSEKAKYICLVRDPKDTVVSAHHFFGSMLLGPLIPSTNTWVKQCMSEGAVFGPWHRFLASYWPWRDRGNVLFITYEQMMADPQASIRKIAELMAVELTDAEVARVAELTSYKSMKAIDHKFYPGEVSPFARRGGQMIRQGKAGSSGDMLNTAQQGFIDSYCRNGLVELGCDFPYDEHYGKRG
ncbi:MAG: hypothetical protein DRQ60_01640 [Gammaproteobacteria bacterium]|nr:MAG: hypothetical protein DRQ54_00835 [Gammaproteobacteria bacterium]RLA15810.1 MAG: hypothetical protein DRQ52_00980 [Gammaproteobacteria bacterium]RLA17595.1 MAG: hypothetical protein DRQ60_01640 [Gammaproteobacteria bacterium]